MPKAARKRILSHNASAHSKRSVETPGLVESAATISLMLPQTSDLQEPTPTPQPEGPTQMRKKDKQQLKRQAFMDRLGSTSQSPYSKSHARRIKRKAKDQLVTTMDDIGAVLDAMDPDATEDETIQQPGITTARRRDPSLQAPKARLKPGQIGEGKGVTLTKKQRLLALKTERLRHPLVMSNADYAENPFETIRKHAQNTLVQHQLPATSTED